MNKKREMIKGLSAVTAVAALCGAFACSKPSEIPTENLTAEYGENFVLPQIDDRYTVYDCNGAKVTVTDGKFFVDDMNGYTVESENRKYTIEVKDTLAPKLTVERDLVYVKLGDGVDFGEITAFDLHDGEVDVSAAVTHSGKSSSVEVSAFTPDEVGVYEFTLSAKDAFDNAVEKTLYAKVYEGFANGYKAADLTSLGERLVESESGISVEYSTAYTYGGETSSLKISNAVGATDKRFRIKDAYKNDVRFSNGIYFYVYNGGGYDTALKLGGELTFSLTRGEWTEVYLSADDFSKIDESAEGQKSVMADLGSLTFELVDAPLGAYTGAELYFSDVYVLPFIDTYEFRNRVKALGDKLDESELAEWQILSRALDGYDDTQLVAIDNHGYITNAFCAYEPEVVDLLVNGYGFSSGAFQSVSLTPREILDKLYIDYYAGEGFTRNGDEILSCNGQFATKQLVSRYNSAKTEYVAKSALNSAVASGLSGDGALKITQGAAYGASLSLNFPVFGNAWSAAWNALSRYLTIPASVYSTYDLDADEDSIYSEIKFKVFVEESSFVGRKAYCSFNGERADLAVGEWTEVAFYLNNKTVKDASFYFCGANAENFLTQDITFYMTSVTATRIPTPVDVQNSIKSVMADGVGLDDERFISAYEAYCSLSLLKRARVSNAYEFIAYIKTKLGVTDISSNKLIDFDSRIGAYQVYCPNATAEWLNGDDNKKYYHGDDSGSLKVTLNSSVWELDIMPILPFNVSAPNGYEFYVYLENSGGNKINFETYNANSDEPFYLKEGEWVKYTVSAGNLRDECIFAFCNDWKNTVPAGVTLYISSIRAI